MVVVPVSMSDFYDKHINRWADGSQGIKHGAMLPLAMNSLYFDSFDTANFTPLATPKEIRSLDFHTAALADCHEEVSFQISQQAQIDGFLCWFDARMGNEWLSTSPKAPKTHWSQVFMPVNRQDLDAEANVSLRIDRSEFGEWHWRFTTAKGSQQHSSFLSVPTTVTELRHRTENYRPSLSAEGRAGQFVLSKFGEQSTVSEIASEVQVCFPGLFADEPAALRFVQGIAGSFGE